MYEPDPDLLAGESAEDETEDSVMSPIPMGPASPFPASEGFTPKEGSPYEAPVYIPEDIPIPPDFELRESSVPGAGLGVWAKRRMEPGERFGPYMVAPRATLKEADFGWEVSVPRCRWRRLSSRGPGPRPRPPAGGWAGRRELWTPRFPGSFCPAAQMTRRRRHREVLAAPWAVPALFPEMCL